MHIRVEFYDGTKARYANAIATYENLDGCKYLVIRQGDAIVAEYRTTTIYDHRTVNTKIRHAYTR